MWKSNLVSAIALAAVALAAPSGALAQDIDTTGGTALSDYWNPFGSPDTATYGQTFTAGVGQDILQSFSLFLGSRAGGSGALSLKGYFGTWDGDHVGSLLYTSGTQTTSGNQEFDFNTGGVGLTAGSQYVGFLSVSDMGTQDTSKFYMPQANVSLDGGNFVFLNNGANFSQIFSSRWTVANPDVAFKATFGNVSGAVPEPSTWAMMLFGFGAVGAGIRRRKKPDARTQLNFA